MDRMRFLVDTLNKWAHEYYVLDNPTVSDKEYDELYDELVILEKELGMRFDDSPTVRVGGKTLEGFKAYKHKARLYSLDKVKDAAGVQDFFVKLKKVSESATEVSVEYKFDGLTLSLTYDKGKLVRAATRGDGERGEDVTEQVKTIRTVPLSIDFKGYLEVVGEGIMRYSAFEEYNASAAEPLKNPRNAAAGAIRNLNPQVTAKRKLDFFAYNVNYSPDYTFATQAEVMDFLVKNKFQTSFFALANSAEEVVARLIELEANRPTLDFMIDGAVIKVNDMRLRDEMGFTEKFPRWAIAYKFGATEATTTLSSVIWQVSRTGKLNPLALLEPVDLMGVTVKRATLNNILDIQKKDIRIGSRVFIRRSNDVIPEIMGVAEHAENSTEIAVPDVCPACGSATRFDSTFVFCTNPDCVPKRIAALDHFASKPCMDIEGFSEKTAEQLYDALGLDSPEKLYALTTADLSGLEGFQDKKAANLIEAIQNSKHTTLARFIFALGIPNIGKKSAKDLAAAFKSIEGLRAATQADIEALPDFGGITAVSVVEYFANPVNTALVDALIAQGITFEEEAGTTGVFSGKNVVLTGSLARYKRAEAQELIAKNGGIIQDNVSKTTNLVIVGADAGSKLEKAKKLGIQIIDEEEFARLLGAIDNGQ